MRVAGYLFVGAALALLGAPQAVSAGNHPGNSPDVVDCAGALGAFLGAGTQGPKSGSSPPGRRVSQTAQGAQGPGAGASVRSALDTSCTIGAFPQDDEPDG